MSKHRMGRRKFVNLAAAVSASPLLAAPVKAASKENRITEENRRPGTREWQLRFHSFDDPITLASYPLNRRVRQSALEGYLSKTGAAPGESIELMVSMKKAGSFLLDIYRMGYYGGAGARHMVRLGPFKAGPQPVPMMTIERLRECAWEKSASISIPKEWPSGVYLGKLTRDEPYGTQNYVIFVVKERRASDVLCQLSDLTWQAYNKWPGKDSLYDDGTPEVWYTGPHVRVSFDRPYAKYCQCVDSPLSSGSGGYILWEYPMTYWLEQQGYDVTYCSNVDLHLEPQLLHASKVFLSVGHDEYWSKKMYDEVTKARNAGLSLAFLSGNTMWHEIEFYESSVTGAPARAYARKVNMADTEKLMGVKARTIGYGDWVVTKPEHWVYEGTGLKTGEKIPAIIGWEYDGEPADIPGLEVLASSLLHPRTDQWVTTDHYHHGVIYPCEKGNWVFTAGTIWWPSGLSSPPGYTQARVDDVGGTFGPQPAAQRITANVLNRMIKDSPRRA
ncbi:MAG TPA: N,N-dimethylformamidase beta subunit family domain-containing protein [Bryobacteraceae bacterium]|nr:N,N-dimethylformamidase beta subunit family domain-containing protein [Bryobacteraceae bacterium]